MDESVGKNLTATEADRDATRTGKGAVNRQDASSWAHLSAATWDAVRAGGFQALPADVEVMASTPASLVGMGFPDLPWVHSRGHIVRECREQDGRFDMENHGIPRGALSDLPALLADPVACYVNAAGYSDRVNLVLDAESELGVPLVASMAFDTHYADAQGRALPCVRVMSVHGRNNLTENLDMSGQRGNVVSADRGRLAQLLRRCGMRMPRCSSVFLPNPWAFPYDACRRDTDADASQDFRDAFASATVPCRRNLRSRDGSICLTVVG